MRKLLLALLLVFPQVLHASTFGDGTFSSDINPAPAAETIAAGGTITANACGTIKQITAGGAVTTSTTNTFTAPASGNSGCVMYVCNVGSNAITLDNNANFKSAAAGNVAVGADDCLTVGSVGSVWYQLTTLLDN